MMSRCFDTIVVGLGVSGVTAATTLAKAGKRVLGLEAQNRVGGRINTVPFGEGVVELGAEWIHGTHPSIIYDAAMKQNLTIVPQDLKFDVYRSDGTLMDQGLINELIDYAKDIAEQRPEMAESLGHYVTRRVKEYLNMKYPRTFNNDEINELFEFLNLVTCNHEAANSWFDVSTESKYTEINGHQYLSWHKYGFKTFFEIMLNTYNSGPGLPYLELKLNTEVSQINWTLNPKGKILVKCKNGSEFVAENVIVTVSLGVLQERFKSLFSPSLPEEKVSAINKLSMGLMGKVMLSFPDPWWPNNVEFFGFMWTPEDRKKYKDDWITQVYAVSSPMASKNVLTFWTNGDVGKMIETLPEDEVSLKLMQLLHKFLGKNNKIPEPTGFIRSTWYSNPFTRGSYTYDNLLTSKHPNLRNTLARSLDDLAGKPRVLFAGEATDMFHFSAAHGAADTGYREAKKLLNVNSKI